MDIIYVYVNEQYLQLVIVSKDIGQTDVLFVVNKRCTMLKIKTNIHF